ncbi:MAG: hypothetical protein ABSF83_14265 [Nitrososphaerales archaeon]|jgi:hypothetical protein
MVTEKTLHFQGKNEDPAQVAQRIEQQLQADGYKTQSKPSPLGYIVQATKANIPRDLIAADRAFTIMVSGAPEDFTVRIGIGKWVQNIGVTAVETILLSPLFLALDVPEMLWTVHLENGIAKQINQIVAMGGGSQGVPNQSSTAPPSQAA